MTIRHSTIANNRADRNLSGFGEGGGIQAIAGATVTLDHAIVSGNFLQSGSPQQDLASSTGEALELANHGNHFADTIAFTPGLTGTIPLTLGQLETTCGTRR